VPTATTSTLQLLAFSKGGINTFNKPEFSVLVVVAKRSRVSAQMEKVINPTSAKLIMAEKTNLLLTTHLHIIRSKCGVIPFAQN
jgi:hypothetical protein